MSPFVSVVVPFRNAARFLASSLAALQAQTWPPARRELIFVDDGSTDGGADTLVERDVTVLRRAPEGPYASRNAGVAAARGSVLAFTDADSAPRPDWLEELVAALDAVDAQVALGAYDPAYPRFPLTALARYENEKNRSILTGTDPRRYYGYTNNMAVTRAAFARYGPFPTVMRGGDAVLVRRAVDELGPESVVYVDAARVVHHEVDSVAAYCRKAFVHARSIQRLPARDRVAPLGLHGRIGAARSAVEGHGPLERVLLWAVLGCGLACWSAGRAAGAARATMSS